MREGNAEAHVGLRWLAEPPTFDPREGTTVVEPPGAGPGWWAGACSALFDPDEGVFYLYYRIRKPRELGRGVECRIARSEDGVRFRDIWRATKGQLGTESMERACLIRGHDGAWRLYLSFVDPADGRWRTDGLEAQSPSGFDPRKRWCIFTAEDVAVEGVKDPWVMRVGGRYFMILSYAPAPAKLSEQERARMHATGDVYNTGITRSHTALAESLDGRSFRWLGDILSPSDGGWDAYAARVSCVMYLPPVWVAYYDGSASVAENYEERTGVATGGDLWSLTRVSAGGPVLTSPHASGSLRYLDVVRVDDRLLYYYEYARPDGSHELRVSTVSL